MRRGAMLWLMVLGMWGAQSAAAQVLPQFDVVSIKAHRVDDPESGVDYDAGHYQATNLSVQDLLARTYHLQAWLITGLPEWARSQRWDIDAKVSEPDRKQLEALTRDQQDEMVKAMLVSYLGMKFHPEEKEEPVFLMTVLPGGPKFTASKIATAEDGQAQGSTGTDVHTSRGHMVARRISMPGFAERLSYRAGRTVMDKTELSAPHGYDLELRWAPEEQRAGAEGGSEQMPLIFEAIREQLGLKLSASKAKVPTMVVDTIHLPETN